MAAGRQTLRNHLRVLLRTLEAQDAHSLQTETSVTDACSIIDQQIEMLEQGLKILRAQGNRLSPISILPAEILSRIYVFLVRSSTTNPKVPPRWIAVTLVCRFWREVSLRTPVMWTIIRLDKVSFARMQLERCMALPLTISINQILPRVPLFKLLHDNIERIRELRVELIPAYFQSVVLVLWEKATGLERVVLNCRDDESAYIREHVPGRNYKNLCSQHAELIPDLFGNSAPNLRFLSISHNSVTLSVLAFPSLQFLYLVDIPEDRRPSTDDFCDLLTNLPLLRGLRLIEVIPSVKHDDAGNSITRFLGLFLPNGPKIKLPVLEELWLIDTAIIELEWWEHLRCAYMAQLFDVPSTVKYRVESVIPGGDVYNDRYLANAFKSLLPPSITKRTEPLRLEHSFVGYGAQVEASFVVEGTFDPQPSVTVFIMKADFEELAYNNPWPIYTPEKVDRERYVLALSSIWNPGQLREICVRRCDFTEGFWLPLLQREANLQMISATSDAVPFLLRALSQFNFTKTQNTITNPHPLDKLAALHLKAAHLSHIARWRCPNDNEDEEQNAAVKLPFRHLLDFLSSRWSMSNSPLQITIHDCVGVNVQQVDEIRRAGAVVAWDELKLTAEDIDEPVDSGDVSDGDDPSNASVIEVAEYMEAQGSDAPENAHFDHEPNL